MAHTHTHTHTHTLERGKGRTEKRTKVNRAARREKTDLQLNTVNM